MSTQLELHHIGEVVLCGLLNALAGAGKLNEVSCKLHPTCTLDSALTTAGLRRSTRFEANVPLAPTTVGGRTVRFDGAHGIDVIAHDGTWGVGIEAKLGRDRLGAATFASRFLRPLTLSTHATPRINGSMTAILSERRLGAHRLALRTSAPAVDLAPAWWLVVRRDTWARWATAILPGLANAHVAIFEEIARAHGDGAAFDRLVLAQVGSTFHSSWQVF